MDSDEIDEFDLQEIEAALYAKIHHEGYEEAEVAINDVEPMNEDLANPNGESSSSLAETVANPHALIAEIDAIVDHVEVESKYSARAGQKAALKEKPTIDVSDCEDVVCLDTENSITEIVISSESDSDIECISDLKVVLSNKPIPGDSVPEPNKKKEKKIGVSSVYKKMEDSPLTPGQLKHLNVHYAYNGEGTEIFHKNRKIRFPSESDDDLVPSKGLPGMKTNLSLNVKGIGSSSEEHEEMLTLIDDIVKKSVFVGAGETSPRVPRTWTIDMKNFYDGLENVPDLDSLHKGLPKGGHLWEIDPVDKYGNRGKNRYFNAPKGRCNNCNQVGHFMKDCPDPIKPIVCNMCGREGHQHFQCKLSMCLQCGSKTRGYQEMCSGCRHEVKLQCSICHTRGHLAVRCPDLWRRYHVSISAEHADKPLKPNIPLMLKTGNCCNCGSAYHSAVTCPVQRESLLPIHNTYKIYSYANPSEHFQSKRLFLQSELQENETGLQAAAGKSASACVHRKLSTAKEKVFCSYIFEEVKKIWPKVSIGECPREKFATPGRGKKILHIFASSAKLQNEVGLYLKNALNYLLKHTELSGNRAVKESASELLQQCQKELLSPHFRQTPVWTDLLAKVKKSPPIVRKKKLKKSNAKVEVGKNKKQKLKGLLNNIVL